MTTDQLSALLAQDPAAVLEHDRRLYEQQIVRAPTAASTRSIPPSSASTARCCGTNWSALPCRSCQMWSRSCGSCRTSRRISCRRIPSSANSSAAARCLTEEEP